jgi:hypothetical protein
MTTYAFPSITPNSSVWELESNTGTFRSPLSNAIRTIDRGGEHWRVRMTFANLRGDNKATMKAFLARLNGQQHRFTLHDHGQVQRGAFGGTPLVFGADQTGKTLNIDGASLSITNWIREGDHFAVNGELKMATADANSDGAGLVTLTFAPRLRAAPANNDPITTATPLGLFVLDDDLSGWDNRPGDLSTFIIVAREDIAA